MAKLSLRGLRKVFPGGVTALHDFSLDIAEREFIAVVGPSGCGKSTLLRLIAGLDEETSGSVLLDGRDLRGVPPRDRDMAIMFQSYTLFPHMTVGGNLAFGLRLRKTPADTIGNLVEGVAAMLGIRELLDRYPSELSGGQRQRAALGRAILRRPKVFLFDEPLSNLDAQMRAQMRVEIGRLHLELSSTMVFVTHDQVEAMTMGDRIVVLKDGVIQQAADPATLYDKPANTFVATFIGSPGMNLFPGRIGEKDGRPAFLGGTFTLPLRDASLRSLEGQAGKEVLLGIRPEDIGSAEARADAEAPRLRGLINVVERQGGQSCLYLEALGKTFAARVDGAWKAGQAVELPLSAAKAVFFAADTGQALG